MNQSSSSFIYHIHLYTVLIISAIRSNTIKLHSNTQIIGAQQRRTTKSRLWKNLFYICGIWIMMGMGLRAQTPLNDYLKIAAEQNPSLKAKYNQYLIALENVNQQGVLPDPTLSFGYFISPVETRVGAQQLRLSISQMFPWIGTLETKEQAATMISKARFEEFVEAKNLLFLNVKTKWLTLLEIQEEIRITTQNLSILRSYEPITKTKYEASLVSLADLVRVQITVEQSETKLELLELKKLSLVGDFNTLLNRELNTEVPINESVKIDRQHTASLDSVLVNQPGIKAIQASLEAVDSEVMLAQLKRKPNIGVGLDYVMVNKRQDMVIPDNGKDVLMPMITLSLPIFGKKNQSVIKEAELKKEVITGQYYGLQNQLRNIWNTTEFDIQASLKEIAQIDSEMNKTQTLLSVLTSEYTNDNRNFEDLLATQQKLLQLQLAKIKSKIKHREALYMREYLTGSTLNQLK
ncbi:TolC family protein [Roseivirga sp.]|uniref:TolC family protein n=1 Tax=Roseivirga sp. TaxID=1964215 RepID=UPI002B26510D|nr:TolC family protein [Roseivirga sp.]